jgi:hypothetical protein
MATLDDVRQKFPSANYAPRDGCKFCDGTGEKKTHPGAPCICIDVSHDMCDFAADSLAATAKNIRKEMGL